MRWLVVAALSVACWACSAPSDPDEASNGDGSTRAGAAQPSSEGNGRPVDAPVDGAAGAPTDRTLGPPGSVTVAAPDPAAQAVRRFVAGERGVDLAEVRLVTSEAVTWPDSSLGCPEPGQMYLQVLTPGYRVVVEVGGDQLTVHTDRSDPPRIARCARPGPPVADTTR